MRLKTLATSLLVLSSSLVVTSCGGDSGVNSDFLNMGVTNGGLILRTAAQSCTDKRTNASGTTVTYSLTAPVLSMTGFSVQWLRSDYNLYIGAIQITVTGSSIAGGSQVLQLDPTEIEALLGAPGDLLTSTGGSVTSPGLYSSTNSSKGKDAAGLAYYPCGLAVGGITFASSSSSGTGTGTGGSGSTSGGSTTMPTGPFNVSVDIELIGTATSTSTTDQTNQKTVMKTIHTTATYY